VAGRLALAGAAWVALAACGADGTVSLRFDVPDVADLQPSGADTLTLIAQVGDEAPRATTAEIGDGSEIDLGDLPIEDEIWLSAELRSSEGQLVGYGRAREPIAVAAETNVEATIPVRRPLVYVAGGGGRLVSMDASVATTAAFQGTVTTSGTPAIAVDVAGTDVATITSAGALAYVSTSTHMASNLPGGSLPASPLDGTSTPDGAWLVVGHSATVSVVEVATGQSQTVAVPGPAARVAVTRGSDGGWWGVALVDRADADTNCDPAKLVYFPLEAVETAVVLDSGLGLSDLAGDERGGIVAVSDRCGDRVLRFDPVAGVLDTTTPVMTIPSPTSVVAHEGQIWAIGHDLQTGSTANVPDGIIDAWLVLGRAVGGEATVEPLAPVIERMVAVNVDYPDQSVTQEVHANEVDAEDLAILPGGQLALLTTVVLRSDALTQGLFGIVVPQLDIDTKEYWLLDTATRVITQRVRTMCTVVEGQCDTDLGLCDWDCLPDIEQPTIGTFTPSGITALFGAR
jgi:hypothetical protein